MDGGLGAVESGLGGASTVALETLTGRDDLELITSDFEDFLTEFLTLPTFDLIKLVNSDLFGLHPVRFS